MELELAHIITFFGLLLAGATTALVMRRPRQPEQVIEEPLSFRPPSVFMDDDALLRQLQSKVFRLEERCRRLREQARALESDSAYWHEQYMEVERELEIRPPAHIIVQTLRDGPMTTPALWQALRDTYDGDRERFEGEILALYHLDEYILLTTRDPDDTWMVRPQDAVALPAVTVNATEFDTNPAEFHRFDIDQTVDLDLHRIRYPIEGR